MKKIIFLFILIYTTGNAQWISINPFPGSNYMTVDFVDSLTGWIAGADGLIIHTSDGGMNWVLQESNITTHLRKIKFVDKNNGWAVGNSGVILHTTNGGNLWTLQNTTPNLKLFNLTAVDSSNVWVAGEWAYSNESFLIYSSNGGIIWDTLNFNLLDGERVSEIYFIDKNIGGYCTWRYVSPFSGGSIYYTSDGGNNWIQKLYTDWFLRSICFVDEEHGWCTGSWSVYHTTNGHYWQRVEYEFNWFSHIYFVDNNIGWLIKQTNLTPDGFSVSEIKFTSDNGSNWTHQISTPQYHLIKDIGFSNKKFGWAVGDDLILYTTNGGGVFPSKPTLITPTNNQTILSDSAIFQWTESTPIVSGYKLKISTDSLLSDYFLTITTDTFFVFTELESNKNYYWQVIAFNQEIETISDVETFNTIITEIEENKFNEYEFALYQNYPNPFNPTTTIKYSIPGSTDYQSVPVKIIVYDMLGRKVTTLVNEKKQPGVYEVEFDGSNLSSGIYYYQLKSGKFTETKKLILIK